MHQTLVEPSTRASRGDDSSGDPVQNMAVEQQQQQKAGRWGKLVLWLGGSVLFIMAALCIYMYT